MLGRITTLNAFGISQILYFNKIIPASNENVKRLEKIASNYIFDVRPTNYSNNHMIRSYEEGGFNLPDIALKCEAQNILWLVHCLSEHEEKNWKIIFKEQHQIIIRAMEGELTGRISKDRATNYEETFRKHKEKEKRNGVGTDKI